MKARKLQKILFGTSLLVCGALTSCIHTNGFAASKSGTNKDSQKKEQKYNIDPNQTLRDKYYKTYADSIRSANGYDSICNLTNNLWNKSAELVYRTDSLAIENSLGRVLQNEVEGAGNKILNDFMKNVSNILKPYHIYLQDYIVEDNDFLWCFNTHTQEENYEDADYILKQPLIYFGVNTCGFTDISGHEFDEFTVILNQIIEESVYGAAHKNEIMNKINALIKKTKPKLISSRKAIERKYADYYVVIDGQDAAFCPNTVEDWSYGYTDTEYPERQTVVQQITTSVNTKNLPVEFFSNKKAKYALIDLGNNKWQITKTSKFGKVETSDVFTDKCQKTIQEYYAGIDARDHCEINFTIENDNSIRIMADDFVVIKRAKSQWYPSREVLKQIDELDEQSRKVATQATQLEQQKTQINQYADSVANLMVNQYFQTR